LKPAAAITLVLLALAGCSGKPAAPEAPAQAPAATTTEPSPDSALPTATITLYFPSSEGDELVAETREIVDTARPAERGTQVLVELLAGPQTEAALPAIPAGTTLRQLWIGKSGIAWADFSEELSTGMTGGSADELLTVYAIVDSLTANVPQIRRVGLLVGGRERDTLAGHVDIRRPLPPHAKKED
jgi:spore germination protein GerM